MSATMILLLPRAPRDGSSMPSCGTDTAPRRTPPAKPAYATDCCAPPLPDAWPAPRAAARPAAPATLRFPHQSTAPIVAATAAPALGSPPLSRYRSATARAAPRIQNKNRRMADHPPRSPVRLRLPHRCTPRDSPADRWLLL